MAPNYCILEYLYRDAGNWKTYGCLLLVGRPSTEHEATIRRSLDSSLLFVPEQVGIPPLQRRHLQAHDAAEDCALDHAFHEFIEIRRATAQEVADTQPTGSLRELALRFEHAARTGWDVRLSPFSW